MTPPQPMTPTEAERLVAQYFKQQGYHVEMPPQNTKGYDIELHKEGQCIAVQVKAHKAACNIAMIQKFRSFLELPIAAQFTDGWFISFSGFSTSAQAEISAEQPENIRLGTYITVTGELIWDYPNPTQKVPQPEFSRSSPEEHSLEGKQATAMVLLDADNLSLDLYHEQYLQKQLDCTINYRIAFANWRQKTSDSSFYSRHYVLIHVPSGQDLADGAMLVFGSSIQKHYPDVDQVFIASNDKIFTSLATSLVQQKYKVYHITQSGEKVTVQNINTGERWGLPKPPIPVGQLIQRVKDLYQKLHGSHFWVRLESLEAAYAQTHGVDFVEELADRIEEGTLLAFLQKYPKNFVVHYTDPQEGPFWFALFNQPEAQSETVQTQEMKATVSAEAKVPLVGLSGQQGITQFEAQLVELVKKLMKEKPERVQDGRILFSDLCVAYKDEYGQSVNDVSTAVTGQRLGPFLKLNQAKKIHIHLKGKIWYVGV